MLLTDISAQLGMSIWVIIIIFAWSLIWKGLALWKAAKKNHFVWFIALLIINTLGILEILYIYIFSEKRKQKKANKKR